LGEQRSTRKLEDTDTGVCIKAPTGEVVSQNSACRDVCGVRTGTVCSDGCMRHLAKTNGDRLERGVQVAHAVPLGGADYDVAITFDGEHLVTLLVPIGIDVEALIDDLARFDVSPRELEVLKLVLQGLSNRQIARRLFIAVSTVKKHLHSIYKKAPAEYRQLTVRRPRKASGGQ
jgi:DNA-binding CsgD family transcriptional regulator